MCKDLNPFITLTWKPVKGSRANSADPDQMPHYAVSDQDL